MKGLARPATFVVASLLAAGAPTSRSAGGYSLYLETCVGCDLTPGVTGPPGGAMPFASQEITNYFNSRGRFSTYGVEARASIGGANARIAELVSQRNAAWEAHAIRSKGIEKLSVSELLSMSQAQVRGDPIIAGAVASSALTEHDTPAVEMSVRMDSLVHEVGFVDALRPFSVRPQSQSSPGVEPDNYVSLSSRNRYQFRVTDGSLFRALQDVHTRLESFSARGALQERIQALGLSFVEHADHEYADGDFISGALLFDASIGMVDLLSGLYPPTAFARDCYELTIGKNLITGEVLSDFERSLAFLGVATVGVSSTAKTVGTSFLRVATRFDGLATRLAKITADLEPAIVTYRKQGLSFEKWYKGYLEGKGLKVVEQVTLEHRVTGVRTRIDYAFLNPETNQLIIVEAKNGLRARLTAGQDKLFGTLLQDWEVRTEKLVDFGIEAGQTLPSSTSRRLIMGDGQLYLP